MPCWGRCGAADRGGGRAGELRSEQPALAGSIARVGCCTLPSAAGDAVQPAAPSPSHSSRSAAPQPFVPPASCATPQSAPAAVCALLCRRLRCGLRCGLRRRLRRRLRARARPPPPSSHRHRHRHRLVFACAEPAAPSRRDEPHAGCRAAPRALLAAESTQPRRRGSFRPPRRPFLPFSPRPSPMSTLYLLSASVLSVGYRCIYTAPPPACLLVPFCSTERGRKAEDGRRPPAPNRHDLPPTAKTHASATSGRSMNY